MGQKGVSNEDTTALMNKLKGNRSKKDIVNRTSYADRSKQVSEDLLRKIFELLDVFYDSLCSSQNNGFVKDRTVYAVDGSHILLRKKVSGQGIQLNKNKASSDGLVLGVYNITKNIPVALELSSTRS